MADSRSNEAAAVAASALANQDKAAGSKEFFVKNAKYLLTLVGFFIKHPAKLYLSFHMAHFEVMLRVLIAVRKAEPIDKQIREIEQNIIKYGAESALLLAEIRKLPSSPWGDLNPLLLLILLPALKDDPEFVKAYNANIDAYENLVLKALESGEACLEAGQKIDDETPPKVKELYDEIERLSVAGSLGTIIKQSYSQRLQFVELDLMTTIQKKRSSSQDCVKYLKACWEKVRGARL
jgi:hypothetical protein